MEGALHRFPVKLSQSPLQLLPEEEFEDLDLGRAEQMLGLVREQLAKIGKLLVFLDDQRDEARRLGIESIAIELCALYEGGRLVAVRDELVDAVGHRRRARITPEGLDYVHRVEKLLAKTDAPLAAVPKSQVQPRNLLEGAPRLASPSATDTLIWASVAMVGLVAGLLVVCHVVMPAQPPHQKKQGKRMRGLA